VAFLTGVAPPTSIPTPTPGSHCGRALDRVVPGLGTVAQGSRRYGSDLRLVVDAAHPERNSMHLLAIGPARSAGVGALCVDAEQIGEAVRIGEESLVAALAAADEAGPDRTPVAGG
jgi:hypothetical protein